jgi:hypothetical protein
MKKFKLSLRDRAALINLIPKTGDIDSVLKYKGWIEELSVTEKEKEIDKSFSQIHDKTKHDEAINDWLDTKNDFEISDELAEFLTITVKHLNEIKSIGIDDQLDAYKQFLGNE